MAGGSTVVSGRWRLGLLLVVCLGFAGFVLTDDAILRYASLGNSQHCLFRLAARLDDAEVVILGSSRVRRGIDPDQLAERLGKNPQRVVNFGAPGQSFARSYVIARDLLEYKHAPVEHLVVEANLTQWRTPRRSYADYQVRPDFAAFASVADLFTDAGMKEGQSIVLRIRDLADMVLVKLDVALSAVMNGRLLVTLLYSPNVIDPTRTNICWARNFDGDQWPEEAAYQRAARDAFHATHGDWFGEGHDAMPRLFQDPTFSRDIAYLRRLVAMARQHGVMVHLVAVLDYYVWPPPPQFLE
jgi:hypothetical protein